ncbi:MAG: hypothetical protein JWO42_3457, partial [Chloroflexi bacterium]|nr:hypothetical protein [Chloroflexota bacterium]
LLERRETAVLEAHRRSVHASPQEASAYLQDMLTQRLTAFICNVKDGKTVARWAQGSVSEIRPQSEQRLRAAYEIATLLLQFDSPQTVRAWFMGLNPQLDDISPATALHDGRFAEALAAARAFVAGG